MTIGGDKRKMKTQIVAILAIVAVITALITVSAVSNEVGYKLSPCDAIDISIENTTVTDFLNATNMTTVHVYNFKGYKGENTWMVQWTSSDRLLDVYVNIATGNIAGIEEKTCLSPTPTIEEAAVEEIKENVVGAVEESRYNVSAYPPFDSEEMKIVMITEEIDSGGSLSLRIIIESKGKEYTFGARKSHYWDDEIREEFQERWLEHIREVEEEAERDWSLSP